MAIGVYVKDFGVGEPGAAVIRTAEHTVVVVDVSMTPREQHEAAFKLLDEAEMAQWAPVNHVA
jgi:hypothetical protein